MVIDGVVECTAMRCNEGDEGDCSKGHGFQSHEGDEGDGSTGQGVQGLEGDEGDEGDRRKGQGIQGHEVDEGDGSEEQSESQSAEHSYYEGTYQSDLSNQRHEKDEGDVSEEQSESRSEQDSEDSIYQSALSNQHATATEDVMSQAAQAGSDDEDGRVKLQISIGLGGRVAGVIQVDADASVGQIKARLKQVIDVSWLKKEVAMKSDLVIGPGGSAFVQNLGEDHDFEKVMDTEQVRNIVKSHRESDCVPCCFVLRCHGGPCTALFKAED